MSLQSLDASSLYFQISFSFVNLIAYVACYVIVVKLRAMHFAKVVRRYVEHQVLNADDEEDFKKTLKNAITTFASTLIISCGLLIGVIAPLMFSLSVDPSESVLNCCTYGAIINSLLSVFWGFLIVQHFLLAISFLTEEHTYEFLRYEHTFFGLYVNGYYLMALATMLVDFTIRWLFVAMIFSLIGLWKLRTTSIAICVLLMLIVMVFLFEFSYDIFFTFFGGITRIITRRQELHQTAKIKKISPE